MRGLSHAIAFLVMASVGACRESTPTRSATTASPSASRHGPDGPVGVSHISQIPASAVASFTADSKGRLKTVTLHAAAPIAVLEQPVFDATFDASGKMLWWTPVLTEIATVQAPEANATGAATSPAAGDD